MGAVSDSIQQRIAQPRAGEDLRPLRERQVRRDDQRRPFGSFTDHLKEQFGADLRERHIAHFVQHDQVVTRPPLQRPAQQVVLLRFHQVVDRVSSVKRRRVAFRECASQPKAHSNVRVRQTVSHQGIDFLAMSDLLSLPMPVASLTHGASYRTKV
jgi:hypothetical protein